MLTNLYLNVCVSDRLWMLLLVHIVIFCGDVPGAWIIWQYISICVLLLWCGYYCLYLFAVAGASGFHHLLPQYVLEIKEFIHFP